MLTLLQIRTFNRSHIQKYTMLTPCLFFTRDWKDQQIYLFKAVKMTSSRHTLFFSYLELEIKHLKVVVNLLLASNHHF